MKKNKKYTDTQRINWLQKAIGTTWAKGFRADDNAVWLVSCEELPVVFGEDDELKSYRSIRNAIDHAMREEAE